MSAPRTPAPRTATPGASVTSRALSLLGAFDERHDRLSLSELAARAAMPLATAHRLAGELTAWGALDRTERGQYVVGRRLWDLGRLAPVPTHLVEVASPVLHDVYGATGATVSLGVRDGLEVLYVDRVRGSDSVPVVNTVGSRLPLHATGVGKVLLAHAPEAVRRGALTRLRRVTPYTVCQPGELLRQLAAVREHDYATTTEEMSLGACSVAVPVRVERRVVAALGVVLPTLQRDPSAIVATLRTAAEGVGRRLDAQLF